MALRLIVLAVLFALAPLAFAQTMMGLPAHSSSFSGSVRGYYFTAPTDFTITGLRVPTDASTAGQTIEVVRLTAAPPAYPTTTNSFTQLYRVVDNQTTNVLTVNIAVASGDVIGILGWRGTSNSYGTGPYNTAIGSFGVTLHRMGMQYNLNTTPAQELWTEASSISRVEMYYTLGPTLTVATTAGTAQDVYANDTG
ncbi:MAG: hypothetical protein KF696_16035, partial [Planctomycetes bacterium]|nr:hypothetical protein [Planctomycetota bacterium]MCW8136934.1 hypothetical protein [Planctomycetota bacterium]